MVKFGCSKWEARTIAAIADRAFALMPEIYLDKTACQMDVTATHLNGCPLSLRKLLGFDDFNFLHDLGGIYRHLNRRTGALQGCFLPRSAKVR